MGIKPRWAGPEHRGDEGVASKDIELILARQLGSCLAHPIFLVDADGVLVFYNEPAEPILGRRFDETGEIPLSEWVRLLVPRDKDDQPLAPETLPIATAVREHRPGHCGYRIHGLDGVQRWIEVTAFPLIGQAGRCVGVLAMFWEVPDGDHAVGNSGVPGGAGS
jgi:PAS domain-containing protein